MPPRKCCAPIRERRHECPGAVPPGAARHAVRKAPAGRVNARKLADTSDADLALQQKVDDASAAQDAALFAQRVRKRLGLTQQEFALRIDVSLDTIRNWEQGKRSPTGAARALLRVLDKAPEVSLMALG